jgi:hypothetical protein
MSKERGGFTESFLLRDACGGLVDAAGTLQAFRR